MRQKIAKCAGIAWLGWSCVATAVAAKPEGEFPTRPITMVVPFAAGNIADGLARIVANGLGEDLGQQVIVENRPGAGGIGAIRQVAGTAPDGYTMIYIGVGMAISQSLFRTAPYDMEKSFTPVSILTSNDVLLLTSKKSKLKNIQDVVREAKAKGDRFTVGISLFGTLQHLSAELFKSTGNFDYTIVPFKSAANLNTALQSGDVDIAFEYLQPMYGLIADGSLNALAIGNGTHRSPRLPDVPTFTELGYPKVQVASWGMLLVPAKTPAAVVERLNKGVQTVLNNPETRARLENTGSRVLGGTTAQARELLSTEIVRWHKVIQDAKIELQ
ncbi:tripartite tricarboxylate transporter substrate binding protein [Pigmentiphaga sp.]|uniref:Bug family tripartite tricarboxylate transporter substrate binding protein n=1 Tax=Pigmentiphaga sp. TaxID=1977564 RepID=UPI0025D4405E|nr:tripartite tricarboxylate transporter substrate binding protein [Pigmentiphaga sp.]